MIKTANFICLETLNFAFLIYGNKLYFSEANTCYQDNLILTYLMLAILIIGYFHMMIYAFIIGFVLVFVYKRHQDKTKKQMGSVAILRSLSKTKFS